MFDPENGKLSPVDGNGAQPLKDTFASQFCIQRSLSENSVKSCFEMTLGEESS